MEAMAGELERLRAEREELDSRIRLLESQLGPSPPPGVEGDAAGTGAGGGGGGGGATAGPIRRRGNELAAADGLPADMI